MRNFFERMMRGAPYVFCWLAAFLLIFTAAIRLFATGVHGLNQQGPLLIISAITAALIAAALPFGFAALLYRIDKWLDRSK